MGLLVGEVYATMGLDKSLYDKNLVQARRDGDQFSKTKMTPTVGLDATAFRSQLGTLVSQFGPQIAGMGQKMTLAVTAPLALGGIAALTFAGNLEQSKIAFETLLRSKPKADAFIKSMQEFAKTTPFEFTDLQAQAKRLLAYGFAAEEVLPMLRDIGDASAALGSGAQGLDAVTRALGQIQAKGKASAEEMLQLTEAGIPAWQMLADAMGTSVADVMTKVTAGAVTSQQAIDAVLTGMQDRYGGLMDKQSKTLLGEFSNLIDALKIEGAKFGEALMPMVKPAMAMFTGLLNVVGGLPAPLRTVVGVIGGIAAAAGPALWAVGSLATGLKALGELKSMLRGSDAAGTLSKPIGVMLNKLKDVSTTLATSVASGFRAAFPAVSAWIGTVGKLLAEKVATAFAGSTLGETIGGAASGAAGSAGSGLLTKVFKEWPMAVALAIFEAIKLGLGKLRLDALGGAFKGVGDLIWGGISKAIGLGGPQISKSLELVLYDAGRAAAWGKWDQLWGVVPMKMVSGLSKALRGAGLVGVIVGSIAEAFDLSKEKTQLGIDSFWGELKFNLELFADKISFGLYDALMTSLDTFREQSKQGVPLLVNIVSSMVEGAFEQAAKLLPFGDKLVEWFKNLLGAGDAWANLGIGANAGMGVAAAGAAAPVTAAGAAVTAATEKTAEDVAAAGAQLTGTLASIPKNAKAILSRDWPGISKLMEQAGREISSGFSGYTDAMLKTFAERTGAIGDIAGSIGAFTSAIAEMPKKALAPAAQNWGSLTTFLRSALNSILNVFIDFTDKQLGKNAERMGSIGSAAGGLGSFLGALAELPKKAIAPTRQAWTALSAYLASAISQILAIFENTKGLGKQAERAGSIGSLAGGLGSFIGALAGLPDKAVAVIPQKWGALAKVLDTAVTQVLKVFEDVTSKSLGQDAERMGSIGSSAGGLGSLIGALVSLPDKAVTVVPQKWKALAKVVRDAVTEVLKVFEDVTTKQLGKDAGRMGSAAGMAGSLGSLLGLFVSGPEEAAKIVPQKWHELALAVKDAVREVLDAYKGVNDELLTQQGTTMGLIGQVVGPLASILDFFANAPATAITAVRQNWAALTATLIEAVAQVVTQFNAVWTTDQLKGNAETMGFVGTMVSTIGSIVDLVASLPDQLGALEEFSMRSGSLGGIWQGVGNALLQIVNALATALDQIPDMTRLAAAQQAVSTLRDIFSSMSDLSQNMSGQLNAGISGGVALGVAGTGSVVNNFNITVPLQTTMGTPSDAELDDVARRLKPHLVEITSSRQRTTFG